MSKTVTITGAAGQIGYQLAFRIASGQLLGPNQKINLNLLEITPALDALNGVAMELDDCAFDTLDKINISDDPNKAFKDSDYAFLVGAKPRFSSNQKRIITIFKCFIGIIGNINFIQRIKSTIIQFHRNTIERIQCRRDF